MVIRAEMSVFISLESFQYVSQKNDCINATSNDIRSMNQIVNIMVSCLNRIKVSAARQEG